MKIPPVYQITPEILELIAQIEANRIFFNSISLPSQVKEKIQRISLLKSSLYSARIEGNPLTLKNLDTTNEKDKKLEVFNILSAIKFIERQKIEDKITKKDILDLHKLVMKDLYQSAGYFRKEMGAIFNQAGAVIYVSPPPQDIPELIDALISYISFDGEKFPIITAFIAHLVFEKIHPFIDGNGRVGRLLISLILLRKNWRFSLNIALEEYLDEHKEDYYYCLDVGLRQTEDYLLFMLRAFWQQTEAVKQQVAVESEKKEAIILPPRQEEIYSIIKEHKIVSFDIIRRRFLKIPERTLRYDLKKLQDKTLVKKIGATKGSFYTLEI